MQLLLKYPGQALDGTDCGQPCAELLRLDLGVAPTASENQRRLGSAVGGEPARYANVRRPNIDIAALASPSWAYKSSDSYLTLVLENGKIAGQWDIALRESRLRNWPRRRQ